MFGNAAYNNGHGINVNSMASQMNYYGNAIFIQFISFISKLDFLTCNV